jgi:hypothetical protein
VSGGGGVIRSGAIGKAEVVVVAMSGLRVRQIGQIRD